MKKLILISLVIFFTICSRSWADKSKFIPDGVWIGNFVISGEIHCGGKIDKIIVEDSIVTLKGNSISGVISQSFDLSNNKAAPKIIRIFNVQTQFLLTLSSNKKYLSLKFKNGCSGKADFLKNETVKNENLEYKLFSTDNSKIPKGTWVGNFPVAGKVHCNANIWKIIVEDSIITFTGLDLVGPIKHSFNIGSSKFKNKIIIINNVDTKFKLYLSKYKDTLTLQLHHGCSGKSEFKLIKSELKKKIENLNEILITSKEICQEIGILKTDQKYGKCILSILKSKGYEDILTNYSKVCEEMEILNTDHKYITCILSLFKNSL